MLSGVDIYCEKAEYALKEKNLEDFLRYIGGAEAVSADTESIARITCLRAKGLYFLRRYDSALLAIEEALKYPQGERDTVRLYKTKAIILTYSGKYKESMRILKSLTTKIADTYLLCEIYINMGWSLLELYKNEHEQSALEEAKLYLDMAYKQMESIGSFSKKRIILGNYAEYFVARGENDMAIEMLEEALGYSSETQLPEIYNDLADLYRQRGDEGDSDLVGKYLHDAELLATRYENDFELARALYIRGLSKMDSADFVQVLDVMYIAFHNFMNAGALSYAFDCFSKIFEVSNSLKSEFVSCIQDKLVKQYNIKQK